MAHNLTIRQLELARWIARAIEARQIDESFHAVWGTGLSPGPNPILIWGDGEWMVSEFVFGEFSAIAEEGFVRMAQDQGYAFPKGVQGYAPTDRCYSCTVTRRLFEELAFFETQTMHENVAKSTTSSLEIFISHSSRDADVAENLIDLIRAALNVPPENIRCTSVDGYRLPIGAPTDDQLKEEVRRSKCFVALLTPSSLRSAYVLFELGARWGAELPFLPLLARGVTGKSLGRPLSGLNALSCSSTSQIHQLLSDIAAILRRSLSSPATYQKCVERLVAGACAISEGENRERRASSAVTAESTMNAPLSEAAKDLLELIRKEPENDSRGVVEICQEFEPGLTHFFGRIEYSGQPLAMKKRLFREAVSQLVACGVLYQPEENGSTNTRTYEYRNLSGC